LNPLTDCNDLEMSCLVLIEFDSNATAVLAKNGLQRHGMYQYELQDVGSDAIFYFNNLEDLCSFVGK
jgi:hypothetical protein